MPSQKRRSLRKARQASKAVWYLNRGYPPTAIAVLLDVTVVTVRRWRQRLPAPRQRYLRIARLASILTPTERHELAAKLLRTT
jgi:hypothetical protein